MNLSRLSRDYRGAMSAVLFVVLCLITAGPIAATGVSDGSETAAPDVRFVTDGTGREVEIPAYPERIVAAGRLSRRPNGLSALRESARLAATSFRQSIRNTMRRRCSSGMSDRSILRRSIRIW